MKQHNCPRCKAEVPANAGACPACGVPLEQSAHDFKPLKPLGRNPGKQGQVNRTVHCLFSFIVFILLIMLMAFVGNFKACQMFSPFKQTEQTTGSD